MMIRKLFITCIFMLIGASNSFAEIPKLDFVSTIQGNLLVQVDINSTFPDGAALSAGLTKHGLAGDELFVGTDFVRAYLSGGKASVVIDVAKKAFPSVAAIVAGKYDLEVAFHPLWPENKGIARTLGIRDSVTAVKVIQLVGNAKGEEAFGEYMQSKEGQMWVMEKVFQGMKWDERFWRNKFGAPEVYDPAVGNPAVLQMYYFPQIDMTIMVNILQQEIVTWREGKALR